MVLDLLSIGDASLDVFITPSEVESVCKLDSKECFVCFSYGAKIPVKTMEFTIGGNAANNSVGTKRLGVASSAVLTLGNDDVAGQIIAKLQAEGVDTTYIITQVSTATAYSTIVSYQGERTIFTYKPPRTYEFPVKLPATNWVYLTSMGDTFQPFYNHLLDWLKVNPQVKLAYNPGSRQLRVPYEQIADIVKRTSILFVNREEAEGLVGNKDTHSKEKELIDAVRKLGVEHPVVTDGGNGAFTYDGTNYLKIGVLPVDAYERTGAGDAFGSGFLAGIIKGENFETALTWGTVNSASVIGYTGAQRGLLKTDEMPIWVDRAHSSNVYVTKF